MDNFVIDFDINKVYKSNKYKNVRFHYVDLRDYLMLYKIFDIF